MKIVVCVKQIAVLGDEIEFTADGRGIDPDFLDCAVNEWDLVATEEALQLRERTGAGEVVVVTVGGEEADAALRRCLAMGADRAVRIDAQPHDPLAIAEVLAGFVADESPDLVLCGVQSADAVQAATGTALAELLGLPRVAVVKRLVWTPGAAVARVDRELEGGLVDVVDVEVPAVLTIQTGINQPRYATLRAIKQAEQMEIEVRQGAQRDEAAYRVRRMFAPPKGEGAELLDGAPAAIAEPILEIVRERLA